MGPPAGGRSTTTGPAARTQAKMRKANLQREMEEQMLLEQESQRTFEYLDQQVGALRQGFSTLSEVMLEEVDGVRSDIMQYLKAREERLTERFKDIKGELAAARSELETFRAGTDSKLASVAHLISAMEEEMGHLRARVDALEDGERVADLEDGMHQLRTDVSGWSGEFTTMGERVGTRFAQLEASVRAIEARSDQRSSARTEELQRVQEYMDRMTAYQQRAAKEFNGRVDALQEAQRLAAVEVREEVARGLQRSDNMVGDIETEFGSNYERLRKAIEALQEQQAQARERLHAVALELGETKNAETAMLADFGALETTAQETQQLARTVDRLSTRVEAVVQAVAKYHSISIPFPT